MLIDLIGPNHIKKESYKNTFKYLLIACIGLILVIFAQLSFGYYLNSTILIASGVHTLVDAIAIIGATIVLKMSTKPNNTKYTYGFSRLETLLGFLNGLLLLFVVIPLLFNIINIILNHYHIHISLSDLFSHEHNPHHEHHHEHDSHNHFDITASGIVLLISLASFIVHAGLAGMLYFGNKLNNAKNILVHSTFLHMLNDVATTFIAIVGSVLLICTKDPIMDKFVGVVLAIFIIKMAISLILKTSNILLEGTPKKINIANVKNILEKDISGLISIYHIHIWQLNEEETLATAIININNINDYLKIQEQIKTILKDKYNIKHIVLELSNNQNNDNAC